MKLSTDVFNKIASDAKVIESRLLDEKRQLVNVGDEIEFSESDDLGKTITVMVKELLKYKTFAELFDSNDLALFGGGSREFLLAEVKQFYTTEDVERYGVVGIRIKALD